jgi:hypothetical protein
MISKAGPGKRGARSARQAGSEPLEVDLTVRFRFGEEPEDTMTPIDQRRVPMVNSVFKNRDRILRAFVALMFKAGMSSPKVVGQLLPVAGKGRRR